ncbi:hypothetical protein ACH5RR_012611 [Cinchona calisaya]|uniref:J domain-containing protein n=1 Tax=Cinchona calisaya TaxID=153742 RepID=A0ABD3ABV0_9GENT
MQAVLRWRNLLVLRNSVIQSTTIASISKTQLADFHSTRISHEKWKSKRSSANKKWNPDTSSGQQQSKDTRSGQHQSKDYIKYKTRQKRADTKKALKNLLFNSGSSNIIFEETFAETNTAWDLDEEDPFDMKDQSKSSHAARRAARAHHKRMKRKFRREKLRESSDDPENVFQASFGNRWCTWSYWSWRDTSHESSTTGFDFKDHSSWRNRRQRESDIESEGESETDSCVATSNSERKILGLPLKGPLRIQDVKNAFRSSALKWHPDKHQGPSQAMAEEKFKLCVDAYKSLCNSLSTA